MNARTTWSTPADFEQVDPGSSSSVPAFADRSPSVPGRMTSSAAAATRCALAQRLDHVAAVDDRPMSRCPAVPQSSSVGDDHILRHVDQTAGQVTEFGGLQRRIGQTFAAPWVEMKYCENVRPSRKFGDRRLDDLARPAWPSGRACRPAGGSARRNHAPGVGHHVDRVERLLLDSLPSRSMTPLLRWSDSHHRAPPPGRWPQMSTTLL